MVQCSKCGSYHISFYVHDYYGDATSSYKYAMQVVCGECRETSWIMLDPPPHPTGELWLQLLDCVEVRE